SRPAVANFMRLLELPESIKGMLSSGAISMGHGRALLGLAPDVAAMERVARKAAGSGLSVRQIEDAIGRIRKPRGKGGARKRTAGGAEARMLEHQLQRLLGTRVRVRDAKGKGTIEIAYSSLDELDRILDILGMNH
ncbi:chromosome partitioning protein ParB, partial [Candidatus Fermentibacterales bacterium]|nr:chromosome partitioning protein ParB [Candidatus Fermentibacterales bacterium]